MTIPLLDSANDKRFLQNLMAVLDNSHQKQMTAVRGSS